MELEINVNFDYCSQVSAYNLNTGEEEILPEMFSGRKNFRPILFGKYIYVFGGFGESEVCINACER